MHREPHRPSVWRRRRRTPALLGSTALSVLLASEAVAAPPGLGPGPRASVAPASSVLATVGQGPAASSEGSAEASAGPASPSEGPAAASEGPASPSEGPTAPSEGPTAPSEGPAVPTQPAPGSQGDWTGIELAPPPSLPDSTAPGQAQPGQAQPGQAGPPPLANPAQTFPDPGMAPNDGRGVLVPAATLLGLTAAGVPLVLILGLRNGSNPRALWASTIVTGTGLLAFSAGGLYMGIRRARLLRRWAIGNRVIPRPQGNGLLVGGTLALTGGLTLIIGGATLAVRNPTGQNPALAGAMIGVGAGLTASSPVMFVVGARYRRRYQRTGGWRRKPVPPLPPGAGVALGPPSAVPMFGAQGELVGVGVGLSGRF